MTISVEAIVLLVIVLSFSAWFLPELCSLAARGVVAFIGWVMRLKRRGDNE